MGLSDKAPAPPGDPEAEVLADALGKNALLFSNLQGREELGRLYDYQLTAHGKPGDNLEVSKAVLGTSTTVMVKCGASAKRYFNGIVTRFSRGAMEGRYLTYHLELRPKLWLATRNAGYRIFEDRTVVQILDAMFAHYGLKVDKQLKQTYATRNYCVQYRETDFNFVSRLMEEEGIYYYFTHDERSHTLVLCDSIQGNPPLKEPLTWVKADDDGNLHTNAMLEWHQELSLQPTDYEHADFEFAHPSTKLWTVAKPPSSKAAQSVAPKMVIRDYPGLFNDLPGDEPVVDQMTLRGKQLAQMRLEEFGSQEVQATGTTQYRFAATGNTFAYKRESGSTEWLTTGATYDIDFSAHESTSRPGNRPGFVCQVQAIPKETPFRTRRTTPKPVVHGPQTAMVVSGADGGGVDKYGRVKVRFHWTKAGESNQGDSCWVRVSQGWAGKNFGMMALPRVGQEVVVSFLDGDPDRPLVTGRVYNAESMPPYELPAQATVTGILSRTFDSTTIIDANELRFEDKAGAEYVWLQAQRDYNLNVRNDATTTVGNNIETSIGVNSTTSIGSNAALTVGQAASATIGADAHLDVATDTLINIGGGMQLNVGRAQAVAVGQGASIAVGATGEINVGANLNVTAGAAMHLVASSGLVIDCSGGITLKCGGSTIMLSTSSIDIVSGQVSINCGGGGSSGSKAQKANPPKPKKAEKPKAHKDPISKNNNVAGKK